MWNNQLDKDRDVVAQLDAIEALVSFRTKSDQAINRLASIVEDEKKYVVYNFTINNIYRTYFYRVRMAAAHAMTRFRGRLLKEQAMKLLLEYFQKKYYDENV